MCLVHSGMQEQDDKDTVSNTHTPTHPHTHPLTHTHRYLRQVTSLFQGFTTYISIQLHIPCRINGFESAQVNISGFLVKPFHHFQSCVFDNETSATVNAAPAQTECKMEVTFWLVSVQICIF